LDLRVLNVYFKSKFYIVVTIVNNHVYLKIAKRPNFKMFSQQKNGVRQ
jgi:hypothetical protein